MRTVTGVLSVAFEAFIIAAACAVPIIAGRSRPVPDSACVQLQKARGDTPWSVWIADALISRNPVYAAHDTSRIRWDYEQGLIEHAFWNLWKATRDGKYFDYAKRNIDYFLEPGGRLKTYNFNQFRLDDILHGRTILDLYAATKEKKYKDAADTLRRQLAEQPRTPEGGFWHKEIYPEQMWLDGLYMAEPFYAEYAVMFGEKKDFDDIARQFILMARHATDPKTGLMYHGWDWSRKQPWSNPQTGCSPVFWGRAMGWYMMGIVDVLGYLPADHPERDSLLEIFRSLSGSLLKYRDARTALWYQVVDRPGAPGNYLEASASAMFMYSFAKGARLGYLDPSFLKEALKTFDGLTSNLMKLDSSGLPVLYNTCGSTGLGGTPYRDGSYEYYVSVPKVENDFRGLGPLILGSIELEKSGMLKEYSVDSVNDSNRDKVVALDCFHNNEWKTEKDGMKVRFHYVWEDTENSGYSELGRMITGRLDARLAELTVAPDSSNLSRCSVFILVDPDTPAETADPHYIEPGEIKAIVSWVRAGGVLVLFANDKGNCEFAHLNELAEHFGIRFNEDSRNDVVGRDFDMGKFDTLPAHPIFRGVGKIYLKEISTLRIEPPAEPVLEQGGDVIMASAKFGRGFVFAVGDPWLYNEYYDNRKLPEGFENYKAARNLFGWLLSKAAVIPGNR